MRTIELPGFATPVSVLGMGTGSPKAFTPETYARGAALLDAFLAAGGNCIDTAHVYGMGASETMLGRWLRERQTRAQVVLITKGGHPAFDPADVFGKPWVARLTPDALRADLSESLERLQTDFIDIYLLHRDDERVPVAPLVNALHAEVERGRIRAFGVSNWSVARIEEANAYAAANHLHGFVLSSPCLCLPRPQAMLMPGTRFAGDAERAWHARTGFPLLAWSALGGGFLSEPGVSGRAPDSMVSRTYLTPENVERRRRAQELAAQTGATPLQIGLGFVLAQPFPTIALVGPSSVAHWQEILPALDLTLAASELAYLDLARD